MKIIILVIRENISTKEKENKLKNKEKKTEKIIMGICLKSKTEWKSIIRGKYGKEDYFRSECPSSMETGNRE